MKYLPTWTVHERDAAKAYDDTLSSLKDNSKPVINTLTELANEYGREFPHVIVSCIEERIKEVQTEVKLPVLYLMDSIVKNHPEQYKKLFARNLVDTFSHVFAKSNERTRLLLFKLRMTWNDYFLASTLAELDHSVKKIDPAWPIATPKTQTNNIHINPAVFARQTSTSNTIDKDSLSAKLQQKELEVMALKLRRIEAEKEALERKLSEQRSQGSNDAETATTNSDRNRKPSRQRPDSTQNSSSRRGHTEVRILV